MLRHYLDILEYSWSLASRAHWNQHKMNIDQVAPIYTCKTLVTSIAVCIALVIIHLIKTYWKLRYFPGPFWARITNIQRVFWVETTRSHEIHTEVHAQYGDYVRMGPNMVSIANPEAIPAVYPIRPGVPKVSINLKWV